jgi:hypothetical protein
MLSRTKDPFPLDCSNEWSCDIDPLGSRASTHDGTLLLWPCFGPCFQASFFSELTSPDEKVPRIFCGDSRILGIPPQNLSPRVRYS